MSIFIPVITVDGPSGVGKGTISRILANKLNWHFLDSGAMYRSLALLALRNNIEFNNEQKLVQFATSLDIRFLVHLKTTHVFIKNTDVTKDIRSEIIGNIASRIAVLPKIREILMHRQRSFQVFPGLIADGRDMGTIVFPRAIVKFFLNASHKERKRRLILQSQKYDFNINLNQLSVEIKDRDYRDNHRTISPLIPAKDALIVDSTNLSIRELKIKLLRYIKQILYISGILVFSINKNILNINIIL